MVVHWIENVDNRGGETLGKEISEEDVTTTLGGVLEEFCVMLS